MLEDQPIHELLRRCVLRRRRKACRRKRTRPWSAVSCKRSGTRGNLEAIDELIAPEFLQHDPATPEEMRGPEDARQYIQMNRSAFPDIRITVENQVAGGDRVSASSVAAGKDTTKERG
jgi:hypothetical protein